MSTCYSFSVHTQLAAPACTQHNSVVNAGRHSTQSPVATRHSPIVGAWIDATSDLSLQLCKMEDELSERERDMRKTHNNSVKVVHNTTLLCRPPTPPPLPPPPPPPHTHTPHTSGEATVNLRNVNYLIVPSRQTNINKHHLLCKHHQMYGQPGTAVHEQLLLRLLKVQTTANMVAASSSHEASPRGEHPHAQKVALLTHCTCLKESRINDALHSTGQRA